MIHDSFDSLFNEIKKCLYMESEDKTKDFLFYVFVKSACNSPRMRSFLQKEEEFLCTLLQDSFCLWRRMQRDSLSRQVKSRSMMLNIKGL